MEKKLKGYMLLMEYPGTLMKQGEFKNILDCPAHYQKYPGIWKPVYEEEKKNTPTISEIKQQLDGATYSFVVSSVPYKVYYFPREKECWLFINDSKKETIKDVVEPTVDYISTIIHQYIQRGL